MARLSRVGTGIHLETHGRGSAILLTHGFGASSRMWDEQIEEFTDRYQMILWDLPGHGESAAPATPASPDIVVKDMLAVLDAAKAGKAVLIGLGVGGVLSLRFWRVHPDRVRGLVLIGTMPGLRSAATRGFWNAQIQALAVAIEREGIKALEDHAEVDQGASARTPELAMVARSLLVQTDDGALPWLGDIDVPVLIIVGSEDQPNLTAAEFMERTIPDARKVVIPGARHAANVLKPMAVNTAIGDFLRGLQ